MLLCFNSSLSIEEIEHNFKDVDLFTGIVEALQDVRDYSCKQEGDEDAGMV